TFGVQPPANTDVDLGTLVAVATAQGATDPFPTADSLPADLPVATDAVADQPTVTIDVQDGADSNATFQAGETGSVQVHGTFGDTADVSEIHSIIVTIPAGFKVTDGGGGLLDLGALNGTGGTVTFTGVAGTPVNETIQVQALANAPEGSYKFDATATAHEQATIAGPNGGSGTECAETDNTKTASVSDSTTVVNVGTPDITLHIGPQDSCIAEDSKTTDANNIVTVHATAWTGDVLNTIVITGFDPATIQGTS